MWIHGYESPNVTDQWDGNWLRATANCAAGGASVWVSGSILRSDGIADWQLQLQDVCETLQGQAVLDCYEPELRVAVTVVDRAGHLRIGVEITPDLSRQRHQFDFDADQTYLPPVIEQCRLLLTRFPARGERV